MAYNNQPDWADYNLKIEIYTLTIRKNERKTDPIYLASRKSWIDKGYNNFNIVDGIDRKEKPSQRVMDGWKKWFSEKKEFKNDIIIAEDDVYVKTEKKDMVKKINRDKINWLCLQKTFKEGDKKIPVGAQVIYIPKELIPYYKEELLKSRSIHFDRWNSRLSKIFYPYAPKEFGEELERISTTTGKVRKGKKLSAKDIEQLLKTRPSNFPELE